MKNSLLTKLISLNFVFVFTPFAYSQKNPNDLPPSSQVGNASGDLILWSRKPGPHHDTPNPERINPKLVKWSEVKTIKKRMFDAQYGRKETYVGIPLSRLIEDYKKQKHDDAIVLHFANRMAILLSLNGPELKSLAPFIALKICIKKDPCDQNFPTISKDEIDSPYQDPRPIAFGSSKFVVISLTHPDLVNPVKPVFSPWKYVDSLIGIEFVNKRAYKHQFFVGEEAGEKVFWQRCQYCHGVRLIGSRMGWDLVTPLPIFEKRSPEILLNHIKYPKTRAKQLGLMMPHQPDMEIKEAELLWKWLKEAAKKPNPAYSPGSKL